MDWITDMTMRLASATKLDVADLLLDEVAKAGQDLARNRRVLRREDDDRLHATTLAVGGLAVSPGRASARSAAKRKPCSGAPASPPAIIDARETGRPYGPPNSIFSSDGGPSGPPSRPGDPGGS